MSLNAIPKYARNVRREDIKDEQRIIEERDERNGDFTRSWT